ncbi:MAG: hypothetical protein AAF919_00530 [Pseudomonadota bacterium]
MIQVALLLLSTAFAGWAVVSLSILARLIRRNWHAPEITDPAAIEAGPSWREEPGISRRLRIWLWLTSAVLVLGVLVFLLLRVV